MLGRRLGRRARGDRGAAAVEFAIVVPVLLLILLGILEFAFVLRDYLSVSSAVRVGARTASTGAGAKASDVPRPAAGRDDAVCRASPSRNWRSPPRTPSSGPGTAMPQDTIDEIWVYRANSAGFPANTYFNDHGVAQPDLGAQNEADMITAGCTTACVKYQWIDSQNRFRYVGGSWDYQQINGCIKDADAVGVYMKATHPMLTSWFFPTHHPLRPHR